MLDLEVSALSSGLGLFHQARSQLWFVSLEMLSAAIQPVRKSVSDNKPTMSICRFDLDQDAALCCTQVKDTLIHRHLLCGTHGDVSRGVNYQVLLHLVRVGFGAKSSKTPSASP